jgi:hypothetical protein
VAEPIALVPGGSQQAALRPTEEAARPHAQASAGPHEVGRLRIRAVDADSGTDLESVRVRALSETRVADVTESLRGGRIDLKLSHDVYAVAVLATGYEPVVWPAVGVYPHSSTAVRIATLHAGSSRVVGRVAGPTTAFEGFSVELLGEGRRPCDRCERDTGIQSTDPRFARRAWERTVPCSHCGFTKSSSTMRLAADGGFAFDRLASGPYALRLLDARGQRDCEVHSTWLRKAETLEIELPAPQTRTVLVHVVDCDGVSLAEEWSRRLRESAELDETRREPEEEWVGASRRSSEWNARFADAARTVAHSKFTSPSLPEQQVVRPSVIGCRFDLSRAARVDDRPREPGEVLLPEQHLPLFEATEVTSEVGIDGRVQFRLLPRRDLTLVLSIGPFSAEVPIPASDGQASVLAQLVDVGDEQGTRARTFRQFESERER